jgi:selenocysteine-specific elongation factor
MSALVARVGLGRAEGEGLAARLEQDGQALRIDDRLLSPAVFDRLIEQLVEHVARHHEAQPDSDGVPREDARARLDVSPRVFDRLLERLAADGRVAGRDRLARAGHHASVTDSDAAALASLERWLREAGLKPPEATDLARRAGLQAAAVDRLLTLLVRQKRVVKMGALVFHQDALDRLKEETRTLKAAALDGRAIVDVASFKARYDVSRKYAIPLLEYLDRERVTRRIGDQRLVV